jgi:penicillin amidase
MQQRSERADPASRPRFRRAVLATLLLVLALVAGGAGYGYHRLQGSLPALEGSVAAPGLDRPVRIERDSQGVATLTAANRADLAYALGFLHAQERFFEMDLNRRLAAGELAELVGAAALPTDRHNRIHRFRARARAILDAMPQPDRAIVDAYVGGVNRGLGALEAPPYPYLLLRSRPQPWRPEDTLLTVFAMYFNLQEADGWTERRRLLTDTALGRGLSEFLYPEGTSWDAALDGSRLPEPELPAAPADATGRAHEGPSDNGGDPAAAPGSNAWAVDGTLTASGSALLANDMHLGLRVPNTWFRARLRVAPVDPAQDGALDATGITLPGVPTLIAGSNGHVAWGFTNAYIDTSDVVLLEPDGDDRMTYRTPDGPRRLTVREESLCARAAPCTTLPVEESVWGPVVGETATGQKLVYRWVAHDADAVSVGPFLELEHATTAAQALAIGRRAGMPSQNMVVADRDGTVGWTVTGPVPRRIGFDGRLPTSWADGSHRWDGRLRPEEVPALLRPEGHRIWTANQRVVGGKWLATLGYGGYALGARAGQIRDALRARDSFAESDMLAIQLDDHSQLLERWQKLLLEALQERAGQPRFAALIAPVQNWGGRAAVDSVGYRIVRAFRDAAVAAIYDAFTASLRRDLDRAIEAGRRFQPVQAEGPVWRLLNDRPDGLVPPGYKDWDDVLEGALGDTLARIDLAAGGRVEAFTWGARNHAGIHSPLTQALPLLGELVDPPDVPLPGDLYQPRVQAPGFGASERFVVSPGHEEQGLFTMPVGQSHHPLSPYYLAGHDDWAAGRPAAFLPGPPAWTLTLAPP